MELLILGLNSHYELEEHLFKFQYGATNIIFTPTKFISNLVFKFQYGATNILQNGENTFSYTRFKFQYGATNIF